MQVRCKSLCQVNTTALEKLVWRTCTFIPTHSHLLWLQLFYIHFMCSWEILNNAILECEDTLVAKGKHKTPTQKITCEQRVAKWAAHHCIHNEMLARVIFRALHRLTCPISFLELTWIFMGVRCRLVLSCVSHGSSECPLTPALPWYWSTCKWSYVVPHVMKLE